MSLVSTLLQTSSAPDYDTSAIQEGFGYIGDDFLTEAVVNLTSEIYTINETYLTADIVGTCKVLTEGADANVLMENIITTGVAKLKAAWEKFLASVRAFFDKVITFFKSMFLSGDKFVSQYGKDVKDKAKTVNKYSYKGYKYDKAKGDAAVKSALEAIAKEVSGYVGGLTVEAASDLTRDELIAKLGKGDKKTPAEVVEAVVKRIHSGSSSVSELKSHIKDVYRGDTNERTKITLTGSNVTSMLDMVSKAKNDIKSVQQDKASFENNVKMIIGKLDKIGKTKAETKAETNTYQKASLISSYLSALMNAYKAPCDAKITMYKEMYRNYLAVLKMFLNFGKNKKVSEGVALEGDDVDDMDMDDIDVDDIDVEEAAIDGADEPEGDTDDIGLVKEGKGCDCEDDAVTEAMAWLNL